MKFEKYPPTEASDVQLTPGEASAIDSLTNFPVKRTKARVEFLGYLFCHEVAASIKEPTLEQVSSILEEIIPIEREFYSSSNFTSGEKHLMIGFDKAAEELGFVKNADRLKVDAGYFKANGAPI